MPVTSRQRGRNASGEPAGLTGEHVCQHRLHPTNWPLRCGRDEAIDADRDARKPVAVSGTDVLVEVDSAVVSSPRGSRTSVRLVGDRPDEMQSHRPEGGSVSGRDPNGPRPRRGLGSPKANRTRPSGNAPKQSSPTHSFRTACLDGATGFDVGVEVARRASSGRHSVSTLRSHVRLQAPSARG